jgi:hypothetical protein
MSNIPKSAVGLCAGRHNIPVEKYIFSEVSDVMDFKALYDTADAFIHDNCNLRNWVGDPLDVVVTGLTQCTTAVMYACACHGVCLTLWHYNRDTGDYVPQRFDF